MDLRDCGVNPTSGATGRERLTRNREGRKRGLLPPVVTPKSTAQRLRKIPGIPGLYRHENGSYYGKKKILGVKKIAALTVTNGQNIVERKAAETALKLWSEKLEKPTPEGAKESFGAWLEKLKTLWGGKAGSTVDKVDWTRRCFEMDVEAQGGKGLAILETPIDAIKPSDLSAFFARRSQVLGAQAFNEMSRIAFSYGSVRTFPLPRSIWRHLSHNLAMGEKRLPHFPLRSSLLPLRPLR